jgi:hypothetical protein
MKTVYRFKVYTEFGEIIGTSPYFSSLENCQTTAYFFLKCLYEPHTIKICAHDSNQRLLNVILTIHKTV